MNQQNSSLKAKIICDLHKILLTEFESGDVKLSQAVMNSIIRHHGLNFLEAQEIDPCFYLLDVSDIESAFYEAINCERCLDLPFFAVQCDAYIDFAQAIRKENEARYGAYQMYHVIVVKETSDIPAAMLLSKRAS